MKQTRAQNLCTVTQVGRRAAFQAVDMGSIPIRCTKHATPKKVVGSREIKWVLEPTRSPGSNKAGGVRNLSVCLLEWHEKLK